MRILRFCVLPIAVTLANAWTDKDYVRKVVPKPDLTEAQLNDALKRIDRQTREIMEAGHVPGLEMAIVKDDKVIWLKGFGYRNLEKKLPMTPDTITCIASCSKAFTSTLALVAVQDGKLSLDDPVRKYLPYFHLKDPYADAHITVADLMCHSSGLPRTDLGWPTEQLDSKACTELLAKCEPTFLFRENAQYSNILVNTASLATSAAYAEPWPKLLKEKITEPLHMNSTSIDDPYQIDQSRMSIGYWFNPVSGAVERERYLGGDAVFGAGAVRSTARDLSNWLRFHLGGGTFEGKNILSPELLAQAYKPRQRASDSLAFGLGWYTDERWPVPVIEHGGDLPGFQSLVCLVPSKHIGIAFSDNNDGAGIRSRLLTMILENFVGKTDRKWDGQPAKEIGTFVDPTAHHLLRVSFDGALWATLDQGKAIRLTRSGWRSYSTADPRNPSMQLNFTDDPADKMHPQVSFSLSGAPAVYRRSVKFNPEISVDQLMRINVGAYGGRANLSMPLNVAGRYSAEEPQEGVHVEGLLVRSNDDLGFLELMYDDSKYLATSLQGVNAASGGAVETNFHADSILGSDLVDAQLDAEICQAVDWKTKFKKVEIIARQELNGEKVRVLRKLPRNSPNEIIEFISENTGLTLRREVGNPASVTVFEDIRLVGRVMLPFRFVTIDPTFHREEIQITSYEPIPRYPHWAFNPIGTAKVPVDK